jgi:hypothetical protein
MLSPDATYSLRLPIYHVRFWFWQFLVWHPHAVWHLIEPIPFMHLFCSLRVTWDSSV